MKDNTLHSFVNAKTKIYTDKGYKNIVELKVGDMVYTHKGRFMPITNLLHREIAPDERSKGIRILHEKEKMTYEQIGEQYNLSAASVCHIINNNVGYSTDIVTVGYSPYSKDCVQVTPEHKLRINGRWTPAKDVKLKDDVEIVIKDRETGEIRFDRYEVVRLEAKTVRAKMLYNVSVEEDASYIAKGIVCKTVT